MSEPLKVTLSLSEEMTLGHLAAFVRHAQLGGVERDALAVLERDVNEDITGFSFALNNSEPGFN
ncbi:hypothetical protein Achl_4156 (plasmid) [Pseudarthrobacter chlorophenolicus A6]|uniref:Uncharacterized protein n=1 Tax=Pseudarthrobacter chlorophenolicus (strain ATCC 700700 / DSM 12829 / CIP 107037 / JCM 12360 / KCTC 9906 / NCIMB 13794 / A6) TaxID=452863 RepID=B8HI60_PSECP|nr:hypothetical protein [Pseudarthrobacter chlorophenolicus]ACL42107.1 hypothetical protein Achl_4156 [Pseudarthrobacter chlorophenolicus A6]SDQ13523.1 hypothetical protein SAMN04489738_0215 [Pseudarthrobacter chlorophenolicus]